MGLNLTDVPNPFILALVTLMTSIWAVSTTFFQYYQVPGFGRFDSENAEKEISRRTLVLMRKVSAITMVITFPLLAKSTDPLYNDEFFHLNSLNKGPWVVLRLSLQLAVGGSVFLYDSDMLFRFIATIGLSALVIINMMSEISVAADISCIQQHVCSEKTLRWSINWLRFFAARDLAALVCCLYNVVLSLWIFPVFGVTHNRFFIPRKEHRDLVVLVDTSDDRSSSATAAERLLLNKR